MYGSNPSHGLSFLIATSSRDSLDPKFSQSASSNGVNKDDLSAVIATLPTMWLKYCRLINYTTDPTLGRWEPTIICFIHCHAALRKRYVLFLYK